MNCTESNQRWTESTSRRKKWPVLGGCLAMIFMVLPGAVSAGDEYYVNDAIVIYPGTQSFPPTIDATNFINNNSFTVNFTTALLNQAQPLYETWDTLNYTNIGLLTANTGFQFDNQSSGNNGFRYWSASFNNSGTISCGSLNNLTDPFFGELAFLGDAQCIVRATNIVNSGIVVAGTDGIIDFKGKHIDLSHSQLTIESAVGGLPGGLNIGGNAIFGLNTNFWDPSTSLGPNFALSAFIPIAPFQLFLTNSTAYIDPVIRNVGGTNIFRAVFIQDTSGSNVNVSVFFQTAFNGLGGGNVTIQWAGSYLDPASGNTMSNYLYLNDDYELGASTNVLNPVFSFPPANFTFTESSTPLIQFVPPATPGFLSIFFPPGPVTNYYDYGNFQVLATTPTNNIPNHSVTNMPGRIQITGDADLDLSFAQLSGQYYTSLVSTNQFKGTAGAFISTPYADLNLGVTNGILYITNTLEANVPTWNGTVQAWNTRWVSIDTNTADPFPGTNDFRVLIVGSKLSTVTMAQVQDLILHDYQSNTIVISDTFNVLRTFNADAQSLTLTTNPISNGSTSLDGELNLLSPNIFWQSSVPRLRYLTNNGAIRMQNLALFGYPVITNVNLPVAAHGTLSEIGTNVVKKDKVTIGSTQYLFVSTLTNSVANQVKIDPTSFDSTLSNLIAAINGGPGAGVAFSTATKTNSQVTVGPLFGGAFTVTARTNGVSGNLVATLFSPATTSTNLSWSGHTTLFGGAPMTTNLLPYLSSTAFINNGYFMDQGSTIYAGNFQSGGVFSNGIGSFSLKSLTTTLTNVSFYAGGDVSITADSLVTSNLFLYANRSLTLQITNLLDNGTTNNANFWWVGSNSVGSGLNLPIKPVTGDLLNTTVTLYAPTNKNVVNVWAAKDYGISPNGYTNNEAIGQLILDVANQTPGHTDNGVLTFNGAGISNAIYVDALILTNFATHGNSTNSYNFPWLKINTNMFIYYAQALENGVSHAEDIDNASRAGANGGRLRWVYSYAGYYSSTNLITTNLDSSTSTNAYNTPLVQSTTIDSDSDGLLNALDPTPFFLPSQINLTISMVNVPPPSIKIQWTTIPHATNFIYYATNMMATNWLPLTNFNNWFFGSNVARTNAAHVNYFVSPQVYINNPMLPDNSQQTNVWLFDAITNVPHYYKVVVNPWVDFRP